MKNQFQYNEAQKPAPVRIEQVWAEKPGGGLLAETDFDVVETTAVGYDATTKKYKAIKSARVQKKYTKSGTTIEVDKGSGFKQGEFIGFGGEALAIGSINTTDASKDVITVTEGFKLKDIEVGQHVYQATAAANGTDAFATPVYTPIFIVSDGDPSATNGVVAFAGNGDTPVRLINGANVRKETAAFGEDIAALIPGVNLV